MSYGGDFARSYKKGASIKGWREKGKEKRTSGKE